MHEKTVAGSESDFRITTDPSNISPWRASYQISFCDDFEKTGRVITAPHYISFISLRYCHSFISLRLCHLMVYLQGLGCFFSRCFMHGWTWTLRDSLPRHHDDIWIKDALETFYVRSQKRKTWMIIRMMRYTSCYIVWTDRNTTYSVTKTTIYHAGLTQRSLAMFLLSNCS